MGNGELPIGQTLKAYPKHRRFTVVSEYPVLSVELLNTLSQPTPPS